MMDNYSAGIRVADAVPGGNKQEYVKYTNDYGEFKGFNAYIYSNKREDLVEKATTIEELQSYRELLNDLPMLKNENANKISANFLFTIGKPLYKDNRETTAITLNINYKDSPNVIVGDFARYTGIGYRYNIAYYNIGIMYSTVDEYEIGDAFGIGIEDDSLKLDWHDGVDWMVSNGETNTLDNLSLNLNGKDTSQWKSWAIVEKDTGRLILGVNKANESVIPTAIYLKFEEKPY
jgi:hypothetical protein